ncbi:RNA chaperone Hfq [Clostridioides difficile]|uniref:RNA chaperone Hfq n=1 Tax=Clostridioides difficile TaxID=1496 RepID=UPI00097FECB5|nr:RNA chaperone Hfq [Clostridioides difficile]SJS89329.1 RNA-binding protein Hfq [Clostridioides difficile]SJS91225.1 RNA-binding protein Hfq [Clostridioides difficile]SJT35186.1 RNA-binding protein Hfq [Clostridioides difficile]
MKNTVLNLQDLFLNNARKERIPVTIYLVNGVQVKGLVKGFDSYIILIEGDNRQQNMIYKHAVSTIQPGKYINLTNQNQNSNNNNNNR